MKIGYCTGIVSQGEKVSVNQIDSIKKQGFDYIELPLRDIMNCTDQEFESLKIFIDEKGLPCEACNVLLSASIETTGPNLDFNKVKNYIQKAMERCHQIGVKVVVFGSAGSRGIKSGETVEHAWQQLIQVLRIMNEYAAQNDVIIAIEPLNTGECNIINTSLEGYKLCKDVNLSHIKLLLDYFHMTKENEPLSRIETVKDMLVHMHIAEPKARVFPSISSMNAYKALSDQLRKVNYKGRMSIEGNVSNLEEACHANREILEILASI